MANERWILDWQDRSRDPARRILVTADTIEDVRASIERLLTGAEWTPPEEDDPRGPDPIPAIQAFADEVTDLSDEAILKLWSGVSFECDDGSLHVVRER